MRTLTVLVLIVASIAGVGSLAAQQATPPLAQECLKSGDAVKGKLRFVRTRHPNGMRIEAYQLTDVRGACVKDDDFCDEATPPTKFHVVPADETVKKELSRSLGKTLTVRAREFFCAHTAWHIGDVVMLGATIAK